MTMGGRPTSGRGGRVVEPRREVVEASRVEGPWRVVEPVREVVEVGGHDGGVLYVLEPVPVRADGRGLVVVLDDLDDVDGADAGVLTRDVAGGRARFEPLPPPVVLPPVPQRFTQTIPALRWQHVHHLGYRPSYDVHTLEGQLIKQENVEHPIPGEVSEIVFGAPFSGYADPS